MSENNINKFAYTSLIKNLAFLCKIGLPPHSQTGLKSNQLFFEIYSQCKFVNCPSPSSKQAFIHSQAFNQGNAAFAEFLISAMVRVVICAYDVYIII